VRVSQRDGRERWELLMLERKTEVLGIERHSARDVLRLIADSMHLLDERGCLCGGGSCLSHVNLLRSM
jgi:hypothetical protein